MTGRLVGDTDANPGPRLAEIAEAACGVILPLWRTGLTIDRKIDDSPVTEADRQAEALILAQLGRTFPGIPVVAEEAVSVSGAPSHIADRFFLVDALDGTKAFVRGDAHFTVNIALIENGAPVAGAVAAPATGEVWFTGQRGAFKRQIGEPDGAPIRVRRGDPVDLLALTSHSLKPEGVEALRARYGFSRHQPLDSSLKLCRIEIGRAHV